MDNRDISFFDHRFDSVTGLLERIADTLDSIKAALETPIEEARQAGRSEVEREYEKAASDKAERATIEDYHRHLAKQIGV